MKAIEIDGVVKLQTEFKEFNRTIGLQYVSNEQWHEWGFRDIITPIISETEHLGNLYKDEINDVFTYEIISATEKTAQELYDILITEGNVVFDEFNRILGSVSVKYLIHGTVPDELKQLVITLEETKAKILLDLDTYLANNDIVNLKKFTYKTVEVVLLKTAIETFK